MRGGAARAVLLAASVLVSTRLLADPLDEVVVSGQRIGDLRAEVVRLDDQFYSRYNALNTRRDFDIHCADEAMTGTRLRRRVCRPVFEDLADSEHARTYVDLLNGTRGSSISAQPAKASRTADFRRNFAAVSGNDGELVRLVKARADAQARLEAAEREASGRKAKSAAQSSGP